MDPSRTDADPQRDTAVEEDILSQLRGSLYDTQVMLNVSKHFREHAHAIGGQQNPNAAVLLDVASQLDRIAGKLAETSVWAYRKETE